MSGNNSLMKVMQQEVVPKGRVVCGFGGLYLSNVRKEKDRVQRRNRQKQEWNSDLSPILLGTARVIFEVTDLYSY